MTDPPTWAGSLLRTLRQIAGSDEVAFKSAGAVLGWLAVNGELAARLGDECGSAAIVRLGEALKEAIDG